jgi:hypothetical protein
MFEVYPITAGEHMSSPGRCDGSTKGSVSHCEPHIGSIRGMVYQYASRHIQINRVQLRRANLAVGSHSVARSWLVTVRLEFGFSVPPRVTTGVRIAYRIRVTI